MPTFDKIPQLEEKFGETKRATGGIYFNEVPSSYIGATGIRPKKGLNGSQYESYYFTSEHTKKKIVLHSTVGFLNGDMGMLAKEDIHMSTNFVIARNGTVYELFNPKYWSYHLGKGAVGGNGKGSKESISIELSNIGPLTLEGTSLKNVYGSTYCSITDIEEYTEYSPGFRGYKYFASFTSAQYIALRQLLEYLTTTYNIPYKFLPEASRVNVFSSSIEANNYSGICSHVNFRATGKYDIGPDFIWENITSDVAPVEPDEDTKFVFEDDTPATNLFDPKFGKTTQTATEKAKESNNKNSSHYCTTSQINKLDETYESGAMGGAIMKEMDEIEWSEIDYTDMEAMRKAATDAIAKGIYDYITSVNGSGNPLHYSLLSTTTGTHVLGTTVVPVPLVNLKLSPISWPSLSSLQVIMNKYYTGIEDLFTEIFENWLGTISITPIEDDPASFFIGSGSITGNFKFKWDSTLVNINALGCKAELSVKTPTKLIETWTIIQDWLFKALSLSIAGEQNGTNVYVPGPSLGSPVGGGASVGFCLGTPANVYTPTISTCTLNFTNPNV